MAERISLRDYQRDLAARLRGAADAGRSSSKLAVQAGEQGWLVDLMEAGEVIPVPQITAVPLAKPWFKGMANIRGNLYSVVDYPAFIGGAAVSVSEHSRLLLIGERFRMGSALLVDRSLGLRNPAQLKVRAKRGATPWIKAEYEDQDGKGWKELDVPALVQHQDFPGPFGDALFAMKVGDIAGPVKSQFGYHLIKLEEIQAGEAKPFETVRAEVHAAWLADQRQRGHEAFVRKLRNRYRLVVAGPAK